MSNKNPLEVEFIAKDNVDNVNNFSKPLKNNNSKKPNKFVSFLKKALPIMLIAIVLILSLVTIKVFVDFRNAPNVKEKINKDFNKEGSVITDRNGNIIYDYKQDAKKEKILLSEIPLVAQHALIVREQDRFYKDPNGIPWYNLGGAILDCSFNIITRNNESCRGGSGLFQQIVKNTTGNDDQSITRKYNELLQTMKVSEDLTKDDILEIYFNNITFGRNSIGVQSGSKLFFGHGVNEKQKNELLPHKACFLASMPNLPDSYTTAVNNKLAKPELESKQETKRWSYLKKIIDDCLDKLSTIELKEGQKPILNKEDATKYKAIPFEEYGFIEQGSLQANNKYPYLVEYIEQELDKKFSTYFTSQNNLRNSLLQGGYNIKTTFDLKQQDKLEKTVENNKGRVSWGGVNMFGSVVLDTTSSEVIAFMGNFESGKVNTVTGNFSYMQPGSSSKPYYYASAFNRGFNPATIMPDVKYVDPYIQKTRYNAIVGRNDGPVSIRYALQSSLNTVAEESMYLSQNNTSSYGSSEGPLNAVNFAKQLGLKYNPNETDCLATTLVAIGSCNVNTLSHANAMATVLNNGQYNEARPIIEIKNKDSIVVSKSDVNKAYKSNQAIDSTVARQTTNILTDYETRRSGILANSAPNFELQGWFGDNAVAAKSGTAQVDINGVNSVGDLSAIGGSPYYTVLAWTGKVNDKGGSTTHALGDSGSTIVPIWQRIMSSMHEGVTPKGFSKEGLIATKVDAKTGLLANDKTVASKNEYLNQNQISILNQVNGISFTDKDNIFKTRTVVTSQLRKDEFEDTITCYIPHALFPDREEFVTQKNNLSGFLGNSLCGAINNNTSTGTDKITSNINENSMFSKKSIEIQATVNQNQTNNTQPGIPITPTTITNITLSIKGPKEYGSNSQTPALTYPISEIVDGKYSILVTTTNSKGEKTSKLYRNVEFKKETPPLTTPTPLPTPNNNQTTTPIRPNISIPVPEPINPQN
jgi:penicillin-binding protein 1A